MTFWPKAFLMPLNSMIGSLLGLAMLELVQYFFELELDRVAATVAIWAQFAQDDYLASERAGSLAQRNAEGAESRPAHELELELQVPTVHLARGQHVRLQHEARRFV